MGAEAVYRIETVLEMKGNVASALTKIAEGFEKVDKLSRDAAESITGIGKALRELEGMSRMIGSINGQLKKLSEVKVGVQMGQLDAAEVAMRGMATAQTRIAEGARDTARAWADATKMAEAAAKASSRMGNNMRPSAVSSHHPDYMMGTMGLQQGGEAINSMTERMLHSAMEPEHIEHLLRTDDRVTAAQIDAAKKTAMDATTSAPGTTYGKNMEAVLDLKSVTGSLDEAIKIMPGFAKMASILAIVDRNHGGSGDPAFAAAKAMEIMGQMTQETRDPKTGEIHREISGELLNKHLAMMEKVVVATGGRVDPNMYLGFAKQSRVGGMMLSDEFIYEKLPALMLAMGGDRAGTAIQSLSQVMVGGKMTEKSYTQLMRAGLADAAGLKQVRGANGKMHTEVDNNHVFEHDLLSKDPVAWVQKVTAKLGADHMVDGKMVKGMDTDQQLAFIQKFAQRGTIAGFLADILKDLPGIIKEQANVQHTSPEGMAAMQANDPVAKMAQFHAALDKLLVTLGGDLMPTAMALLDRLTAALNAMSAWAQANPGLATTLTEVVAGLGALAAVIGTVGGALILAKPVFEMFGIAKAASVAAPGAAGASTTTTAAGAGLMGAFTSIMAGAAIGGLGAMWGAHKLGYGDQLDAGIDALPLMFSKEGHDNFANNWANGGKDAFLRGLNPFSSDPHAAAPGGIPPDVAAGLARMANPPPPPPPQPINTTVNLQVDGKTLASVVEQHMSTALSAPNAGTSHFDAAGTRVDPGNVGH